MRDNAGCLVKTQVACISCKRSSATSGLMSRSAAMSRCITHHPASSSLPSSSSSAAAAAATLIAVTTKLLEPAAHAGFTSWGSSAGGLRSSPTPSPVDLLLPPGLPPRTIVWTVSSELLGFCFYFFIFPYFLFMGRALALDKAGHLVSFWAHDNLSYRIVWGRKSPSGGPGSKPRSGRWNPPEAETHDSIFLQEKFVQTSIYRQSTTHWQKWPDAF